jgi:ribonuclease-3
MPEMTPLLLIISGGLRIVVAVLMKQDDPYAGLEEALGYRFREHRLLEEALTHRSRTNEAAGDVSDNQRLEFLGDSILGFLTGRELFLRFPSWQEGDLSRVRASLVDEENLAALAREIGVGGYLHLGRGEDKGGGREKKSILADAFEAIIAAVYLDGGLPAVQKVVRRHFGGRIAAGGTVNRDWKSALQELTQARYAIAPVYRLLDASGPDHDRHFRMGVYLGEEAVGEGDGRTKKEAQQAAARRALEWLA